MKDAPGMVWRMPVLLCSVTLTGLVVALVFDAEWAASIGSAGIALPLVVMLRCLIASRALPERRPRRK